MVDNPSGVRGAWAGDDLVGWELPMAVSVLAIITSVISFERIRGDLVGSLLVGKYFSTNVTQLDMMEDKL